MTLFCTLHSGKTNSPNNAKYFDNSQVRSFENSWWSKGNMCVAIYKKKLKSEEGRRPISPPFVQAMPSQTRHAHTESHALFF